MTMLERAAQIADQLTRAGGQTQDQSSHISPFLQGGLSAIRNNDAQKGEEIANKILQQAGISREQAMQIAHQRGLI